MELGARSVLVAVGVAAVTSGCAEKPTQPATHTLSGPVVVVGYLVDVYGDFSGTRIVADADGLPVELLYGERVVARTHTTRGSYRFDGLEPGGYRTRVHIDDVVSDMTGALTIAKSSVHSRDTLRLVSRGDLYPVPNPAIPATRVYFEVPETTHVFLRVRNVEGAHVRTLVDEEVPAGLNGYPWLGDDETGRPVPSGIYWLTLTSHGGTRTHALFH